MSLPIPSDYNFDTTYNCHLEIVWLHPLTPYRPRNSHLQRPSPRSPSPDQLMFLLVSFSVLSNSAHLQLFTTHDKASSSLCETRVEAKARPRSLFVCFSFRGSFQFHRLVSIWSLIALEAAYGSHSSGRKKL